MVFIIIIWLARFSVCSWWVISSMVWLWVICVSVVSILCWLCVFRWVVGLFSSSIGVFLSSVCVSVRCWIWLLERFMLCLFSGVL